MRKSKIFLLALIIIAVVVTVHCRMKGSEVQTIDIPSPPPSPNRVIITPEPKYKEPQRVVVVTEYQSEDSEAWLWETIGKYSPSDMATAGIMAYYFRESYWRSDAVGGWAISQAYSGKDHCALFTSEIDAGLLDGTTREEFVRRCLKQYGGYGLGQWASPYLTEALYDFAQEWGTSIADAEMQCAFTVWSMQSIPELWQSLLAVENPATAGWLIATLYDGTSSGAEYISNMATVFYKRWAE